MLINLKQVAELTGVSTNRLITLIEAGSLRYESVTGDTKKSYRFDDKVIRSMIRGGAFKLPVPAGMVELEDAAKELGLASNSLYAVQKRGMMTIVKVNGRAHVSRTDIDIYKAHRAGLKAAKPAAPAAVEGVAVVADHRLASLERAVAGLDIKLDRLENLVAKLVAIWQ